MNPAFPVAPQTQRHQPLQTEYQSLISASETLFSNPSFLGQDFQSHRDQALLSPFPDPRSRATSVSSAAPYTSDYTSPNLPFMSLKVSRESSSAGFLDDQHYNTNESHAMETEDEEEDEGTPTPDRRALPSNEQSKLTGGKNFPHKLYNVVNESGMWSDDGLSFNITNPVEFSRQLSENKTFKQSSFQSFIRQLNMYDFTKINRAPRAQRGAPEVQVFQFRHNKGLFQRGKPELVKLITRKSTETPSRNNGFAVGLSHDASTATATGELKPQDAGFFATHESHRNSHHVENLHQTVTDLQQTVHRQESQMKLLDEQVKQLCSLVEALIRRIGSSSEIAHLMNSEQLHGLGFQSNIGESQSSGSNVSIPSSHTETQLSQTPAYSGGGPANFGVPTSTNQPTASSYESTTPQPYQHLSYPSPNLGTDSFSQPTSDAAHQYHQMGPLEMTINPGSPSQQGNMPPSSYGQASASQPQPSLLMPGSEHPHYSSANLSPTGPPSPQHHLSSQSQHSSPLSPRMRALSPPVHGRPLAGGRSFATAAVPMAEPPPQTGFNLFRGSSA